MQTRSVHSNVIENKNFIDTISDPPLQLTLKKTTSIELLCSIKDYPNYLRKLIKYSSLFQLPIYVRLGFSSLISAKIMCCYMLGTDTEGFPCDPHLLVFNPL